MCKVISLAVLWRAWEVLLARRLWEPPSPSGRACIGNTKGTFDLPDPTVPPRRVLRHCPPAPLQAALALTCSLPMLGGARSVWARNTAWWALWTSQGAEKGRGHSLHHSEHSGGEVEFLWESFPRDLLSKCGVPSQLGALVPCGRLIGGFVVWCLPTEPQPQCA